MQFLRSLRSYRYELIAFLTGAAVMVLEIVGARLIAPVFGTSTYVWTAMIGVILASLAVGYTLGGRLADRDDAAKFIGIILFLSALLVLATGLLQASTLEVIASWRFDLRISALIAAIMLFGPPSALIGMVSPHLAKVRVTSLETTGASIGRLEAAGALGSIAGTFSCGYFLLGAFGSRAIIIGVVIVLLLTSFLAEPYWRRRGRLIGLGVALLMATVISLNPRHVLADVDSSYARYQVVRSSFYGGNSNLLVMDRSGIQSAVSRDEPDKLVLSYTQQFQKAATAYPDLRRVLVIGGGAFTFPSYLDRTYPKATVDVAEIDPALDDLSRKYFFLNPSERLRIHHQDGRAYLNTNTTKYDMIFMDAYSSLSPPFQLTTREVVAHMKASLTDSGVVVVNAIGGFDPGQDDYVRALVATYGSEFKYVSVHQLDTALTESHDRQNLMLFASNDPALHAAVASSAHYPALDLRGGGLVLTDNYAPIERLTYSTY